MYDYERMMEIYFFGFYYRKKNTHTHGIYIIFCIIGLYQLRKEKKKKVNRLVRNMLNIYVQVPPEMYWC